MLICYSIASLLGVPFCSTEQSFGLVCVGLLVYLVSFISVSLHVSFLHVFSFILSLLSIESLNQFHFNHTYNSTFTVQAITFLFLSCCFRFSPILYSRLYVFCMCSCCVLSSLFSAANVFMCDSFRRGSLSMAAKSVDSVGAKIMILEAIRFEGFCLLLSGKKRLK